MKHTLRDILIFFFSILGFSYVYRTQERKHGPLVRVIAFHDVRDGKWFQEIISLLVSRYHILTPEDFIQSRFEPDRINVLVTFDDGYASWVNMCLPILASENIHVLFFINSGLLTIADDQQKVKAFMRDQLFIQERIPLTWEGMRILLNVGHTIGGHSYAHADLTTLKSTVLHEEIEKDRILLKEHGVPVLTLFAYPFGRLNNISEEVKNALLQSGYTHLFSAETGFVRATESQCIPRTLIEENQSRMQIQRWIEGGYDIFAGIVKMLK